MVAGDGYDIILDSNGYMVDYTDYRRRTIPAQREQRDTSEDVGEQTLSNVGQWVRSQTDWSNGAGQPHYDLHDSDRLRFHTSKNVDIFNSKGQLRISSDLETKITGSNSHCFSRLVNGSVFYTSDGQHMKFGNPNVSSYSPSSVDMNNAITDWTSDGSQIYCAQASNGIRKVAVSATSGDAAFGSYQADVIEFANGRLIAADGARLTELDSSGSALTFDRTLTGTCVEILGGPQAIYFAFNQNGQGVLYAVTPSTTDGALSYPVPAAVLPVGEEFNGPFGMDTYGDLLAVSTTKGFRLGLINGNDQKSVTFGPLLNDGGAAYSTRIVGKYVYWGTSNGDVWMGDLTNFVEVLQPAYCRFLAFDSETKGNVQSIEVTSDKVFFTDSLGELYGESFAGTKSTNTELVVGTITYGTTAKKVLRSASARFDKAQQAPGVGTTDYQASIDYTPSGINYRATTPVSPGSLTFALTDDENQSTNIAVSATAPEGDYSPTNNDPSSETFILKLTLVRDTTDTAISPTVERWSLNARPQPERMEEVIAPLVLSGRVQTSYGAGASAGYDSKDEYLKLRTLATSARTVTFTEGELTESVTVEDIEMSPIRYSDDGTWWEGVCLVRLVTVP
tara:strand:- start:1374 stop:3233 length:1860 start_codon:yes stop_codon:yes gene_type:complete